MMLNNCAFTELRDRRSGPERIRNPWLRHEEASLPSEVRGKNHAVSKLEEVDSNELCQSKHLGERDPDNPY